MSDQDKNVAPKPGTPEHDEAMVKRFEEGTGKPSDEVKDNLIPPMPEIGREKFYNKETGEYNWKAHAEEDAYLARKAAEEAAKKQAEEQVSEQDAEDALKRAGLDAKELGKEIVRNGDLSKESREALKKAGIPESIINEHVELVKFRIERAREDALNYIGGEEAWRAIHDWAVQNLTQAEKDAYNKMLASEDWRVAIDTLKTRMGASAPGSKESRLVTGAVASTTGVVGFRSRREQIEAQKDPRYRTDPAYRQEVIRKIAVSTYSADESTF